MDNNINEDLNNISFSHLREINLSYWFQDIQYNGKTLNENERSVTISEINKVISQYEVGLPIITQRLKELRGITGSSFERTLYSVELFVISTMIDCMVAGKYFLLADRDYDKRYMRGKMKVVLNEGFKKLYGFTPAAKKESEWGHLQSLLEFLPEKLKRDYQDITSQLEKQSSCSSWWKEDRDIETHLDSERLYESRMVVINESKVMMESAKLYSVLMAVSIYLYNVNACLLNYLIIKHRRGELNNE